MDKNALDILNQESSLRRTVLKASLGRASWLAYFYSFAFGIFGVFSLGFLREFIPTMTIWQNLLPRLLFNSIPLLIIGWIIGRVRDRDKGLEVGVWLWITGVPVVFTCACLIYVWPILTLGSNAIYVYVHGANILVPLSFFLFVPLPFLEMMIAFGMFSLLFYIPLIYLLLKNGGGSFFSIFANDSMIAAFLMFFGCYSNYSFRLKVARKDLQNILMLETEIEKQKVEIRSQAEEALKLRVTASLGEMATEIAHDIRSPLAALGAMSDEFNRLPEVKKKITLLAISRITDIANSLLRHNRSVSQVASSQSKKLNLSSSEKGALPLATLIEEIVSEKCAQYASKFNLEIVSIIGSDVLGLIAEMDQMELKRVLSNFIDNSVQALGDKSSGRVSVEFKAAGNSEATLAVVVRDNGKGIPAEIIKDLGKRGSTYGKEGGSGLGLYHAFSQARRYGGEIKIESRQGLGTAVTLTLKRSSPKGIG